MKELEKYRSQIDWLDKNIMEYLSERFDLVKKIGDLKKQNAQSIYDEEREGTIIHYIEQNTAYVDEITEIYKVIMNEAKKLQENE